MKRWIGVSLMVLTLTGSAWGQQSAPAPQCVEENARTLAAVNQLNSLNTQNIVLQGRIEMLNQKIKELTKAQSEKPAEPQPQPEEPKPTDPTPADPAQP